MPTEILALRAPGPIEWLVIFMVFVIVFGIPVLLIVLFVKYLSRSKQQRQKLNQQMKKLTDELQQIQEQTKGDEKEDSSAQLR